MVLFAILHRGVACLYYEINPLHLAFLLGHVATHIRLSFLTPCVSWQASKQKARRPALSCKLVSVLPVQCVARAQGLADQLRGPALGEYERTLAAVFTVGADLRRNRREAAAKAFAAAVERCVKMLAIKPTLSASAICCICPCK